MPKERSLLAGPRQLASRLFDRASVRRRRPFAAALTRTHSPNLAVFQVKQGTLKAADQILCAVVVSVGVTTMAYPDLCVVRQRPGRTGLACCWRANQARPSVTPSPTKRQGRLSLLREACADLRWLKSWQRRVSCRAGSAAADPALPALQPPPERRLSQSLTPIRTVDATAT